MSQESTNVTYVILERVTKLSHLHCGVERIEEGKMQGREKRRIETCRESYPNSVIL